MPVVAVAAAYQLQHGLFGAAFARHSGMHTCVAGGKAWHLGGVALVLSVAVVCGSTAGAQGPDDSGDGHTIRTPLSRTHVSHAPTHTHTHTHAHAHAHAHAHLGAEQHGEHDRPEQQRERREIPRVCSRVVVYADGAAVCGEVPLANLTNIQLANLSLTSVPAWPAENTMPPGVVVKAVDLRRNALLAIALNAFKGLPDLQTLDLGSNAITSVATGSFPSSGQLQTLYLDDNLLGTNAAGISADWLCCGLSGLQALYLSSNFISRLTDGCFRQLPVLAQLTLNNNIISSIGPHAFYAVPGPPSAMQSIHLFTNQITEMHADAFAGLTLLDTLSMASNMLTSADPRWFQELLSLRTLSLASNKITALPAGLFCALRSLTWLDVKHNVIQSLGPGVFIPGSPHTTTTTAAAGSTTTSCVDTADQCNMLPLSACALSSEVRARCPAKCGGCTGTGASGGGAPPTALAFLNLEFNALTAVHGDAFMGLNALGTLLLNANKLTIVDPAWLHALGSLHLLLLGSNAVTALPPNVFASLTSLTNLELLDNQITALVPDVFAGLTNLAILLLQNNAITTLANGTFEGLSHLTQLQLHTNHISVLGTRVFAGLRSLTHLSVNDNRITQIPGGLFDGLSALSHVYFDLNEIHILPDGLLHGAPNLQARQIPAAAPCAPVLPLSQSKNPY